MVIALLAACLLSAIGSGTDPTLPYGYVDQWATVGSSGGEAHWPEGVAADTAGHVYVLEDFASGGGEIQKYASDGTLLARWSGDIDGSGGIAVDTGGNVYVSTTWSIQKFSPTGTPLMDFDASVSKDIAVDGSGNIYRIGMGTDIEKYSPAGTYLTGWNLDDDPGYSAPAGLAVDPSGTVYVTDWGNDRVLRYSSSGALLATWGTSSNGDGVWEDGEMDMPQGIAVDAAGYVYVVDSTGARVQKFTSTGTFVSTWGSAGAGDGQFNDPQDIAIDAEGRAYVADRNNHRIQAFAPGPFPPVAAFRTNVTSGVAPFSVRFTDTTANMPTAWAWDFGDGETSSVRHPVHVYQAPGTYTVRLTATSRFGTDDETATVRGLKPLPFIEASPQNGAAIPLNLEVTIDICYPGTTSDDQLNALIASIALKRRDTGQVMQPNPTMVTQTFYHRNEFGIIFAREKIHTRSYSNLGSGAWYDLSCNGAVIARYPTVIKVPGGFGVPTDTNGDGKYDDVNGNLARDFNDIILYFQQIDWIQAKEPPGLFDYNENWIMDFADVIWLFGHL